MITEPQPRPRCQNCKVGFARPNGTSKLGFKLWHKYCSQCARDAYHPQRGFLLMKRDKCQRCGFLAEDLCQTGIYYLDGDKKNRDVKNMQVLCQNCLRLRQKQDKDKCRSILDITVDADIRI